VAAAVVTDCFVYSSYEHQWMGLCLAANGIDGGVNAGLGAGVKYLTGYVVARSLIRPLRGHVVRPGVLR
jgi:hypothetical protein